MGRGCVLAACWLRGARERALLHAVTLPLRPPAPDLCADINYPNRGAVLTYPFGDPTWCPLVNGSARNRTLSLEFTCDPTIDPNTANYAAGVMVREENVCDYRVFIPSLAGCPLECRTGSNLCSGAGVCGYNADAARSQCFCFSGAAGGKCEAGIAPSKLSVEGILLIVVCIMLAGVVGLVAFMFMRLRKLTVDPAAYENLQGRCEWEWAIAHVARR